MSEPPYPAVIDHRQIHPPAPAMAMAVSQLDLDPEQRLAEIAEQEAVGYEFEDPVLAQPPGEPPRRFRRSRKNRVGKRQLEVALWSTAEEQIVQFYEQEKELLAEKASIALESQSICEEVSAINTERAFIEQLKLTNPVDPQIPIRELNRDSWRSANGNRGMELAKRRSVNKVDFTMLKKRQEGAAAEAKEAVQNVQESSTNIHQRLQNLHMNATAPAQSENVQTVQVHDLAAEASAIKEESKAIARDNAALESERRAIEKLKRSNPKGRIVEVRQRRLKQEYAAIGERGKNLGLRKAALKEATLVAKSEQLSLQAYVPMQQQNEPASAHPGNTYHQMQSQDHQMYALTPAQSGYPYTQMQSQFQSPSGVSPTHITDFHDAPKHLQVQSDALARSDTVHSNQASGSPDAVHWQQSTQSQYITAPGQLNIRDSTNIVDVCNALRIAQAQSDEAVRFTVPTVPLMQLKMGTTQLSATAPKPGFEPFSAYGQWCVNASQLAAWQRQKDAADIAIQQRMQHDSSEMSAWKQQQASGKIILQQHKQEISLQQQGEDENVRQQRKRKNDGAQQQRKKRITRQQKRQKTNAGQQQEQEEPDTGEVLDPEQLPARYGTGPYIGTGFNSDELTRDYSNNLEPEELRQRDARRQVLGKIMHTALVPLLYLEQAGEKATQPASVIDLTSGDETDTVMDGNDVTGPTTAKAEDQVDAVMEAMDLVEIARDRIRERADEMVATSDTAGYPAAQIGEHDIAIVGASKVADASAAAQAAQQALAIVGKVDAAEKAACAPQLERQAPDSMMAVAQENIATTQPSGHRQNTESRTGSDGGPSTREENGEELQTQTISIPSDMAGFIMRFGGSKISQIRNASGVQKVQVEIGEGMVTILGTAKANETALQLLDETIEAEKSRRSQASPQDAQAQLDSTMGGL